MTDDHSVICQFRLEPAGAISFTGADNERFNEPGLYQADFMPQLCSFTRPMLRTATGLAEFPITEERNKLLASQLLINHFPRVFIEGVSVKLRLSHIFPRCLVRQTLLT